MDTDLVARIADIIAKLQRFEDHVISELGGSRHGIGGPTPTPGNVPRQFNELRSQLNGIAAEIEALDAYIRGTANTDKPGVLVRVDRLERAVATMAEADANRGRQMWALTMALISAVLGGVVAFLVRR